MDDKLVFGFGINDIERCTVGSNKDYYEKWSSMLYRCYGKKFHEREKSYIGCKVSEEWRRLSKFMEWVDFQPERDWVKCHLDKDLIVKSNKVYSPENCCFIPQWLNHFVTNTSCSKRNLPVGVSFHKARGKFVAQCRNPLTNKKECIGYFDDPNKGHIAWLERKREISFEIAKMQIDKRVSKALISRFN